MSTSLIQSKSTRTTWTLKGSIEKESTPQTIDISVLPFRIGRRPELELSLASSVVSARHAEMIESAGLLCIRDLSSTNGTYVNGNRIYQDTLLSEGDWIEVGDVHLRVDYKGSTAQEKQDQPFLKTQFINADNQRKSSKGLMDLFARRALGACFQPIHYLSDRDIHGYEFLARSEVDGVTNPGLMFQAAEAVGREVELSMLCREMGLEHSICLPQKLPLFLNTHPSEPLMESVVPQMRLLRERYPNRPLVLEIHEKSVTEPRFVRQLRDALHEFDVRLAFDDFGAGQARIRELICAPLDYIKFDAALIHDLQDVSREQIALFRSIITAVRNEGAITVAEGVESDLMVEICHDVGFDLVQGYAMSRPAIMAPVPCLNPNDTAICPS